MIHEKVKHCNKLGSNNSSNIHLSVTLQIVTKHKAIFS